MYNSFGNSPSHTRRNTDHGSTRTATRAKASLYDSGSEETRQNSRSVHTSVGFVVANAESESLRCGYMRDPPRHPKRGACSIFRIFMLLLCSCSCVMFGGVLATLFLIPTVRLGDAAFLRMSTFPNSTAVEPTRSDRSLSVDEVVQRLSIFVHSNRDGTNTIDWTQQSVIFPHWSGTKENELDYKAVLADVLKLIEHTYSMRIEPTHKPIEDRTNKNQSAE